MWQKQLRLRSTETVECSPCWPPCIAGQTLSAMDKVRTCVRCACLSIVFRLLIHLYSERLFFVSQIAEYKKLVRGTWSKIEAAGAAPSQAFHKRLNEMDAAAAALFAGMCHEKLRWFDSSHATAY
jgi:hypothetical protein